ncbi:MAG: isocitrate/isopropylmalate dehydrogenase family protein [Chloroflexota bacterium]|nr:isocitrate/isopropylmalate dehydrogenase family protein [Chloroflexota bacterium]
MNGTICAIPGDGIGREVVPAAVTVLQRVAPDLRVEWAEGGYETWRRTGEALPERTLRLARGADATLFGAVSSPLRPTPGYQSAILLLRRTLDLYACVRPVRSPHPPTPLSLTAGEGGRAGVLQDCRSGSSPVEMETSPHIVQLPSPASGRGVGGEGRAVDLIIVRENTEGLYGGGEESDGERAVARRVITRAASTRIARLAFDMARRLGRRRVTIVHKATVLPQTDGLFREAAFAVARDYPEIVADEALVDSAAMRLAAHPESFDMIVTTNLFGDILSDVAVIHGGGLGLAPSANIGDTAAVFEPVHGSAPDIAGRGVANPLAAILAGAMLLDHLGRHAEATTMRDAVGATIAGPIRTPDLGGIATTKEVTDAVVSTLPATAVAWQRISTAVLER